MSLLCWGLCYKNKANIICFFANVLFVLLISCHSHHSQPWICPGLHKRKGWWKGKQRKGDLVTMEAALHCLLYLTPLPLIPPTFFYYPLQHTFLAFVSFSFHSCQYVSFSVKICCSIRDTYRGHQEDTVETETEITGVSVPFPVVPFWIIVLGSRITTQFALQSKTGTQYAELLCCVTL